MPDSREMRLFFELFEALPRQGPGNEACARRAFALCRGLPETPRIVDLGCGAGAQTMHLAAMSPGHITAIDAHGPAIETLRTRALHAGVADRIDARVGDMAEPGLPAASFDLVWSEGALYNLGLARALPICAGLLRPDGWVAFTDAVWHSDDAPADVRALFEDYPTMGTVHDVLSLLKAGGWREVHHFDLPASAWWDAFYTPMEAQLERMRAKYAEDDEALAILDTLADEPSMHRRSGEHYGYTFFVARRP